MAARLNLGVAHSALAVAVREDRRVIAEAMEREADAVDGKPGESDMEQIVGVGQASALRAFARALRGEP